MRFILAVSALFLAGLSFGARDAMAAPAGKRVALLGLPTTNPFTSIWTSTFMKAAASYGMKVTNLTTPFDAALQSQQIDDAIAQKYDMIVLCYVNDQAIRPALIRAKAAGVPVVLWAAPMRKEHEDLFLSFIGTDQTELGRIAGENMAKGLAQAGKTKAQIVAVTGIATQYNVQARMAAFRAALAKHPGITIVAEEDAKWQTPLSEKITGELLVRFGARGGIDGVFAMADYMATGAIRAVAAAGLKLGAANKGIVVVASNCTMDGIKHINTGEQYSTVSQIPAEEAEMAAKKIAAFFNGQKPQKYEVVKPHGVTKENVAQFAAGCSY